MIHAHFLESVLQTWFVSNTFKTVAHAELRVYQYSVLNQYFDPSLPSILSTWLNKSVLACILYSLYKRKSKAIQETCLHSVAKLRCELKRILLENQRQFVDSLYLWSLFFEEVSSISVKTGTGVPHGVKCFWIITENLEIQKWCILAQTHIPFICIPLPNDSRIGRKSRIRRRFCNIYEMEESNVTFTST